MTGVDHREPGLAAAALTATTAYVELIADGQHVHPSLWPIVWRTKPADRLLLVSDALPFAGMGDGRRRSAASTSRWRRALRRWPGTGTLAGW